MSQSPSLDSSRRTDRRIELTLEQLGARRGHRELFTGLSLTASGGDLILVTGSNGSGKTTLLRIVAGLTEASAGWVEFNPGRPGDIAYLGHQNGLQPQLTARENLRCQPGHGSDKQGEGYVRTERLLARLGLAEIADLPTRLLSQGQKRRVALARIVQQAASLWVLDEPSAGLDVAGRELLCRLCEEFLAAGGICLVATHDALSIRAPGTWDLALTS